jgi:CheY-like chemotaxis protein
LAKTIIFADDSVTMRKVGEITFAGAGYELVSLAGGAEVVAAAKQKKPAVIVLDTVMPDVDGYEACRRIRADAALASIPVLLMAGPSDPVDEARAREAGASGHIVKPFETQSMIEKVEALAAAGAAAVVAARPAAAAQPAAAKPATKPRPAATAKTVIGLGAMGKAPAGTSAAASQPARPPAQPPASRPAPAQPAARPHAPPPTPPHAPDEEAHARAKTTEMSPEEIRRIEGVAREIIERVVWEVVPDLAETIIREELAKLLKE